MTANASAYRRARSVSVPSNVAEKSTPVSVSAKREDSSLDYSRKETDMAKAQISKNNLNIKSVLVFIAAVVLGIVIGGGVAINVTNTSDGDTVIEAEYSIELSEEQVPAIIENDDGSIEILDVPTVEEIDSDQAIDEEKLEEVVNLGQGAWHDISSPETYKNAVLGLCTDVDGFYGSQCVDLMADFHLNYVGSWLTTCGTGAAYGLWDCRYDNAGDSYELIEDPTQLQAGDWVIFRGGQYGHVGMAMGGYNNGYVALLGQNQGGSKCNGGGSAANIINMSLKTFMGAFRPKMYVKPEPAPQPVDKNVYVVKEGDTMGKIMEELEGKVEWGEAMDDYAKTWYSTSTVPGQQVYYGWHHNTGVGLFAGDTIERR